MPTHWQVQNAIARAQFMEAQMQAAEARAQRRARWLPWIIVACLILSLLIALSIIAIGAAPS